MGASRTSFMLMIGVTAPVLAQAVDNRLHTTSLPPPPSTGSGAFDTLRVIGALLLVLMAIWACRWIMQRMARLHPNGSSASIRVLSRIAISPRQRILAIQIAQRVLIVADSGQQLTTLCQITDPQEVAILTGQSSAGENRDFADILRRQMSSQANEKEYCEPTGESSEAAVDVGFSLPRQEVRSLLEKVRGLSRQFR